MPHDITAIRAHLKRFMTNIRDVLTTEEDFIRYETLCARLQNLDNLTKMHYTAHPVLTREYLHTLIQAYEEAALAADEVLSEEETGPVGLQLKTVVRELMPYLMSDLNGLNLLNQNPTLPEKPLSELISQVRTQTADMEDAYAVSINRPVLIRLNSPTTNEIGLFTPSRPGDANEHKTAFSRMAAVLGGPDLVVKTRPLMLTHGGASTAGVFVSQTEGLDPLKVRPGDPLLAFKKKNLDTGAAISDLAGMQLMDFLASGKTLSRGPEDCYLRFNPDSGAGARLIGLSIKPDTIRFSAEPFDPAALSGLSVIPAGLYEQLQDPTFETQLRLSLQDVPLPEGTIEQILARRSALVEKVERDRAVYQDAAPGFVQPGKLRVVPDDEWDAYHLGELAAVTPGSPFDKLLQLPAASIDRAIASEESFPLRAYPAIITGNGLYQEKDPLNTQREGTLKLQIPVLNGQTALKGAVSSRYPIQFRQNDQLVR
ncbi:MAG: hypothetical protein J5949_05925, partial [Oscillospiraceae bacterium]|nr:hypothetical protein [Oscillospiraceae bacterium]